MELKSLDLNIKDLPKEITITIPNRTFSYTEEIGIADCLMGHVLNSDSYIENNKIISIHKIRESNCTITFLIKLEENTEEAII